MKYQYNFAMKGALAFILFFIFCMGIYAENEVVFKSISLDEEKVYIQKDESLQLTPVVLDEGADVNLIWSSEDSTIATVENGVITGLKSGTTSVTVANEPKVDGAVNVDSVVVRVYDSFIDLDTDNAVINGDYSVSPQRIFAGYGGTIQIDLSSQDISEMTFDLNPISDSINSVVEDGKLLITIDNDAVANDYELTITGKFNKDEDVENALLKTVIVSLDFKVNDIVPVESIVTGDTYVDNGEEVQLNYTILPTNATNKGIRYSFNTYSGVLETRDSKLIAKKRGSENVTVQSAENGIISGITKVIVVDSKIDSSSKKVSGTYDFNLDNIYTGYNGTVTFEGIDINDAVVEVKKGLDTIENGFTASVLDNTITIAVSDTVSAGTYSIKLIGRFVNDENVVSSDEYTFDLEVINNILIEEIVASDMIIPINYNGALDYSILPNTATNQNLMYQVSDNEILEINDGIITAKKNGTTSILISTQDGSGVTKTINVTVDDPKLNYDITNIVGDTNTSLDTLYTMYEARIDGTITSTLISDYSIHVVLNDNIDADAYFHLNTIGDNFTLTADKTMTVPGTYTIVVTGTDVNGNTVEGVSTNNTFIIYEVSPVTGLNASDIAFDLDDEIVIPYEITPLGASNYNVLFEIISGDDIISVTADGKMKGLKTGDASLKISSKENPDINKVINVYVRNAEVELYNYSIIGDYNVNTNVIYESYGGKLIFNYNESDVNEIALKVTSRDGSDISSMFTYAADVVVDPLNANTIKRLTVNVPSSLDAGEYSISLIGKYVDDSGKIASSGSDTYEFSVLENVLVEEITGDDMYIPLDFNGKINYNVSPNNVVNNGVTFSNYDDSIISVSDDGMITAHSLGETTVTIKAKDKGQKTGTVKVIVTEPYFSYEITSIEGDYYINPNAIYQFQSGTIYGKINPILTSEFDIKVDYINGTDASSLFDFDIDEVNNTFEIAVDDSKSLAQGYTIIMTGKDKNGNVVTGTSTNNSFTILNNTLINSIEADDITMLIGDVKKLTYELNNDALNKDVDVSIKDGSDVISLDENLNITGLESGIAHILIKAKDASNLEKVVTVKVVEASANMVIDNIVGNYDLDTSKIYEHKTGTILGHVDCVDINEASFKIYKDDNLIESGFDIDYASSLDGYNFTVNVSDNVTAGHYVIVFEGEYLYDGTALSGVTKDISFDVFDNVLIDTITATDIYIKNGDTKKLEINDNYFVSPSDVTNDKVDFEIPDEFADIIQIDADGIINALAVGNAKVNLVAHDSGILKCTVNVYVNDIGVKIDYEYLGNEDYFLGTDKIYEHVGGKLKLNPVLSDDSLSLRYEVYDSNDENISDLFEFYNETIENTNYNTMNIPNSIPAGVYKLVAIASTTETDNPVVVKDYKMFTVNENILVGNIIADDPIIPIYTCYDLLNNIILISQVTGKEVTNSDIDVIVADDDIVSYENGQLNALGVGNVSVTLRAKDAGGFEKSINVEVVDVYVEVDNFEITGLNSSDSTEIYNDFGGKIEGTFNYSNCDDVSIDILYNGISLDESLYIYDLDYSADSNVGSFSVNIFDGVEYGDYQLHIIVSKEVSGSVVYNYDSFDFVVFPYVYVESIEIDDLVIGIDDKDYYLNYDISPSNVTNSNFEFIVQNQDILNIDDDGLVTPLKNGSTDIIISADDGRYEKKINVRVVDIDLDAVSTSYFDFNGNSVNNIFTGGNYSIVGVFDTNNDLQFTYEVYKGEELVTDLFDRIDYYSSSFELTIDSNIEAGTYKLVLSGSYLNSDGDIVDSDSIEYEFVVLDPSKITSITFLSKSLRNQYNSVVDSLTFGSSGSLNVSYRLVNGIVNEVHVFKDNDDVTNLFDELNYDNNSLFLPISDTVPVGSYKVIVKAALIENDVVTFEDSFETSFVIDEAPIITTIEAQNISIKIGDRGKINYQPSNLNVIFIVNDSSIIDIDDSGNVIPKKVGQTSVTIRSALDSSVSKTINVVVYDDNLNDIGYTISDDMISDIDPSTDLSTLVSNITKNNNVQVRIYTSNNVLRTSGIVATGDIIEILNGESVKRFEAVVPGDASGDGRITALDYIAIRNHIMGSNTITKNAFVKAADYSKDNKISALDYIAIRNYIMKGAN